MAERGSQPEAATVTVAAITAITSSLRIFRSKYFNCRPQQAVWQNYIKTVQELQLCCRRLAFRSFVDRRNASLMPLFLSKLFSRAHRRPARALYAAIVERARRPERFKEWGVPDTASGRFEVLALHLFLVMQRLRAEDGLSAFARTLSEEAVLDMDRNLREMGTGDLSVGRKVKSLAEALYGRFGACLLYTSPSPRDRG